MRLERRIPDVLISSKIRSERYTQPFSPCSFEMFFRVQIKQSGKSERLVEFFWCRQDQKGIVVGLKYVYFKRFGEIRARRCALTGAFLMS